MHNYSVHGCTSVQPMEVAKMATKSSLAPLQKHSLDGCTICMPPLNCYWLGAYHFTTRYLVIIVCQSGCVYQYSVVVVVAVVVVVSASLHRAKRYWYRTFVLPICRSSHVSSGNTGDWIRMPFWMVSLVGLNMGVWDFGGDRRRGRGSLGVNTMQKWRIDRLSTRVCKDDNISDAECIVEFCEGLAFLWYSQVQDQIGGWREIHVQKRAKRNQTNATWRYAHAANSYGQAAISLCHSIQRCTDAYAESSRISLGLTHFQWRQHARAVQSQ